MSDEVVKDPSTEKVLLEDETTMFFEEPEGGMPDETAKVIEELKAKQAELAARVDPVEAMKSAIQGLGEKITPPVAKPDVSVKADSGVQDWKQYKDQFNQKVFEDPFEMVTELVSKASGMQAANQANANLAYSRRIVQVDPSTKDLYKRWADEVEAEVARMPVAVRANNPNVYEDALKIVKANHVDELIEERIKEKAAAQPPERKPGSFTETGQGRVASASEQPKQKVGIAPAKMREIRQYAEECMIPEDQAIRIFNRNNWM